jgi:hypothetical protein
LLDVRTVQGKPDFIDIWYTGRAGLDVAIVAPAGVRQLTVEQWCRSPEATSPVAKLLLWLTARSSPEFFKPTSHRVRTQLRTSVNGTLIAVTSTTNDPHNHDHRIAVQLLPRTGGRLEAGPWKILLRERSGTTASFHAWIGQAGYCRMKFDSHKDPKYTVTAPGCARGVMTVGAYHSAKGDRPGELLEESASGPTRKGSKKPDLCAPGAGIWSADFNTTSSPTRHEYRLINEGTSFAAPHVAGVVALMLECNKSLSPAAISHALIDASAWRGPGAADSDRCGAGKLDARCALSLVCPEVRPSSPVTSSRSAPDAQSRI